MPGSLALCRMPPGQDQERLDSRSPRLVVTVQRRCLLVPVRPGDVGLEERVGVEVELGGQELGVPEDLRGAGIALGGHEAGLLEERQVDEGLDVAHAARIAVPVPGAPEVAGLLDDPDVGDPVLGEVDRREHSGEAAAHDHHGGVLDHRVTGEAGFDERVPVQLLAQLAPLGHALGPQPLLLLAPVPLTQFVERGSRRTLVLVHCLRTPLWAAPVVDVETGGDDPATPGGTSMPAVVLTGAISTAEMVPGRRQLQPWSTVLRRRRPGCRVSRPRSPRREGDRCVVHPVRSVDSTGRGPTMCSGRPMAPTGPISYGTSPTGQSCRTMSTVRHRQTRVAGQTPPRAGDGNRTRVSSLGSWRSTIELHPR